MREHHRNGPDFSYSFREKKVNKTTMGLGFNLGCFIAFLTPKNAFHQTGTGSIKIVNMHKRIF